MNDHVCARFKMIGSMRLEAGSFSIVSGNLKREHAVNVDQVELACMHCGAKQWVDRERCVVMKDKHIEVLKE